MKVIEARRLLERGLATVFEPAGFKYRRSLEAYVRPFEGGSQLVYLGFWPYPPTYVFSLTTAIRVDTIEDVYHEIRATPDRERQATVSLLVQLWQLAGMPRPLRNVPLPGYGAPFYYEYTSEEELTRAFESIAQVATELILPFFNEYSRVESVNQAINHRGLDISNGRILSGLIAARLSGDPAYPAIVCRYRKEMEAWQANDREVFERAVKHLSEL